MNKKWIDLKKRKPENDTFVQALVHVNKNGFHEVWPIFAFYHDGEFLLSPSIINDNIGFVSGDFNISHWIKAPSWHQHYPKKTLYNRLSKLLENSSEIKELINFSRKFSNEISNTDKS